ncbi:hypothetical protein HMPREF0653_00151 [Prevotella disiens JCM 6334 = ATCC 29426]|uniref:Uncharacterized protein n=1 Tax=Prevotella disiens JCM 6334 = ATCC 29426 TaxID=1235811 RepID=A0ABN0NVB2_9BACT|nr:hypothetical protein HMPREF0653_00151 [Prevotella disiens JCM 6334 = ATCC 29426]
MYNELYKRVQKVVQTCTKQSRLYISIRTCKRRLVLKTCKSYCFTTKNRLYFSRI